MIDPESPEITSLSLWSFVSQVENEYTGGFEGLASAECARTLTACPIWGWLEKWDVLQVRITHYPESRNEAKDECMSFKKMSLLVNPIQSSAV